MQQIHTNESASDYIIINSIANKSSSSSSYNKVDNHNNINLGTAAATTTSRSAVLVLDWPKQDRDEYDSIECYYLDSRENPGDREDHQHQGRKEQAEDEQQDDEFDHEDTQSKSSKKKRRRSAFRRIKAKASSSSSQARSKARFGWPKRIIFGAGRESGTDNENDTPNVRSAEDQTGAQQLQKKLNQHTPYQTQKHARNFVSSQDDLDWSTMGDIRGGGFVGAWRMVPTMIRGSDKKMTNNSVRDQQNDVHEIGREAVTIVRNNILQPLVHVYVDERIDDEYDGDSAGDDGVSCLSDELYSVLNSSPRSAAYHMQRQQQQPKQSLECVLPNVLYLDDMHHTINDDHTINDAHDSEGHQDNRLVTNEDKFRLLLPSYLYEGLQIEDSYNDDTDFREPMTESNRENDHDFSDMRSTVSELVERTSLGSDESEQGHTVAFGSEKERDGDENVLESVAATAETDSPSTARKAIPITTFKYLSEKDRTQDEDTRPTLWGIPFLGRSTENGRVSQHQTTMSLSSGSTSCYTRQSNAADYGGLDVADIAPEIDNKPLDEKNNTATGNVLSLLWSRLIEIPKVFFWKENDDKNDGNGDERSTKSRTAVDDTDTYACNGMSLDGFDVPSLIGSSERSNGNDDVSDSWRMSNVWLDWTSEVATSVATELGARASCILEDLEVPCSVFFDIPSRIRSVIGNTHGVDDSVEDRSLISNTTAGTKCTTAEVDSASKNEDLMSLSHHSLTPVPSSMDDDDAISRSSDRSTASLVREEQLREQQSIPLPSATEDRSDESETKDCSPPVTETILDMVDDHGDNHMFEDTEDPVTPLGEDETSNKKDSSTCTNVKVDHREVTADAGEKESCCDVVTGNTELETDRTATVSNGDVVSGKDEDVLLAPASTSPPSAIPSADEDDDDDDANDVNNMNGIDCNLMKWIVFDDDGGDY